MSILVVVGSWTNYNAKETLIHCLCSLITALCATRSLAYLVDMSALAALLRLVLKLARLVNQRFLVEKKY